MKSEARRAPDMVPRTAGRQAPEGPARSGNLSRPYGRHTAPLAGIGRWIGKTGPTDGLKASPEAPLADRWAVSNDTRVA